MAMTGTLGAESVEREPHEVDGLTAAACLFHGFSDPSRVAILQHLSLGEHRVVDLTAHLSLAQSTVSKHLACLRDCGLVTAAQRVAPRCTRSTTQKHSWTSGGPPSDLSA